MGVQGQTELLTRETKRLRKKLERYQDSTALLTDMVRGIYADFKAPKIPAPSKVSATPAKEIAVVHLSDLHIGKVTSSYNIKEAERRLQALLDKITWITKVRRRSAPINEIRVMMGGDMIEGEQIFAHQAHVIEEGLLEQAVRTAPMLLRAFLGGLLKVFPKVYVRCVDGNHGRNGPRGTSSHPLTNWDKVCYEILKQTFNSEPRIKFHISDSFYDVDYVFDWGNMMVHGHEIRGGFAGFPWYGVGRKMMGWIDSIDAPWDYLWLGHFHTYAGPVTVNHRIFLANGTFESDNEYAQANMASVGLPCQRLCFFSKDHGMISDNQVFLGGKRVPQKRRKG